MARAENIVTRTILIAPVAAPLMTEQPSADADADAEDTSETKDPGGVS